MKRRRISALVFCCLLAAGCAEGRTQDIASQSAAGEYAIAGTVVDSASREPVSRVSVAILSTPAGQTLETVLSEPDGHFAFKGLAAGKYSLTASRTGYRPAYFDQHEHFNSAIVTGEGQDTENLIFPITPSAALRISVTDDFGEPVEGARIYLFRRVHWSGMSEQLIPVVFPPIGEAAGPRAKPTNLASTNDTGEERIYNLEPGDYYAAVSAHPWYALNNIAEDGTPPVVHSANPVLDVAYPTTYFDGATSEAEASPIVLGPGNHEHISIVLHAVPALRIRLPTLQASEGEHQRPYERPPELLPIVFGAPMEQPERFSVDETANGDTLVTGLAPSEYEMRASEPRRRVLLSLAHSQDISPSAGSGAATLTVKIQGPAGVTLPPDARLSLSWNDKTHPRQALEAEVQKNACEFEIVPQGVWELSLVSQRLSFPVVSTTVAGETHAGNLLRVGDKPIAVDLSVRAASTQVEGIAQKDGKGKAGVLVLLVPENAGSHTDLFRRDQSDSDGSFTFRSVAPGAYTAFAIEDGWEVEWQRPEILAHYLSKGVAVNIPDGVIPNYRLPTAVAIQPRWQTPSGTALPGTSRTP